MAVTDPVARKDLAGVHLHILTDSPELTTLCEWHFDRLPPAPDSPDSPTAEAASIEIFARLASSPVVKSTTSGPDISEQIGRMKVSRSADQLTIEHEAGALAVVTHHRVELDIWAPPSLRWLCLRQTLFIALTWTLAALGRVVLHGALVSRDQQGVLILGGTGQGKSTLALAALATEAEIHSDDLVVAERAATGLRLWGIPKRISAPPEIQDQLRATQGFTLEPVPGDPRSRSFLPLSLLAHRPLDDWKIALAAHHDCAGELEPLSASTTRELVIGSFEFARDPDLLRQSFPTLIGVGSRPGLVARHTADPATRFDVAAQLLDELLG